MLPLIKPPRLGSGWRGKMADLTAFQRNALDAIRHVGGSIFYESDKSWTDKHGQRVFVPAGDFRTEGFIGWPTIRALMDEGKLVRRQGNEYALA